MFDKLNRIELSGVSYPLKCDMVVLEQIQDIYGDVGEFEKKIMTTRTETGEDGREEVVTVIPDAKAVNDGLYLMISEGLEIEDEKAIERKELLRKIDVGMFDLAYLVHSEFLNCFRSRKNGMTTQNPQTQTPA